LEFGAPNLKKAKQKRQCQIILLQTFAEWKALKRDYYIEGKDAWLVLTNDISN